MEQRRLHPALLVHTAWVSGSRRLVAQVSAARPPLILNDPLALSALRALPAEFDRETATGVWSASGVPEGAHDALWAGCEAAGLFTAAGGDRRTWWEQLGWAEARTYHEATRDYPFVRMDERQGFVADAERMSRYRDESPAPSVYQCLGGRVVELARLSEQGSPDEQLARMSAADRRGRAGIGLLLDVCFGERGRIELGEGGSSLLKSIPSGGARHPTEVFLAAFELEGIPAGTYHYDVENHHLVLVRAGQQRQAFAHATLDLFGKYDTPPAGALVFTSLVERAMWRYRDPRSFRAVLVDVGHAVMAYRHVARMLGFRTYANQKMRDREVAELVGLDRVTQPPLYVGTLVP